MGKLIKWMLAIGIVLLLSIYVFAGVFSYSSINAKISVLETQAMLSNRKKDALGEKAVNLAEVRRSLAAELALAQDQKRRQDLLESLQSIATAQREKYILEQQALLDQAKAADQARLAQLAAQEQVRLAQIQARKASASSSSPGSSSTGTSSIPAATPPPRTTRAS